LPAARPIAGDRGNVSRIYGGLVIAVLVYNAAKATTS
jgi:hypothetical protein